MQAQIVHVPSKGIYFGFLSACEAAAPPQDRKGMSAQPNAAPPESEWKPRANPWLIAISVMLATFLEVLDTSVANVALPHMAGNLSARHR